MNPISFLDDAAVQQLLVELGVAEATATERQEILADVGENIMSRVLLETLEALPEDKQAQFNELLEKGDIPGIVTLVQPEIPDFNAHVSGIAKKEIDDLKVALQE